MLTECGSGMIWPACEPKPHSRFDCDIGGAKEFPEVAGRLTALLENRENTRRQRLAGLASEWPQR
jgi:hypothetical protein